MLRLGSVGTVFIFITIWTAIAATVPICDWYLRTNSEKICMSAIQQTSPAIAVELGAMTYYANLGPENRSSIKVQYGDQILSVYDNPDEYELIHWLSGEDELVNNVWVDRMSATTADTGALNFYNYGCTWNAEHDGYYSVNGVSQYFSTKTKPALNFGTDWFVEIVMESDFTNLQPPPNQQTNSCNVFDLGSVTATSSGTCATAIAYGKTNIWWVNNKPRGNTVYGVSLDNSYTGGKIKMVFGVKSRGTTGTSRTYLMDPATSQIRFSNEFTTVNWGPNNWNTIFYLFRGVVAGGYSCLNTTIYDIKVYRRKTN